MGDTNTLIVNRRVANSAGVGAKEWVVVNRWSKGNLSLNLIVSGAATFDVEGTLMKVNEAADVDHPERGAPAAGDIFTVTNATGLTASAAINIVNTPLEAVRINQTAGAGSVVLHVQGG